MAIGRDILDRLDEQDYDTPDPLQSDTDLDEKKEVKNYLEASFDRGILSGLPKKSCGDTASSSLKNTSGSSDCGSDVAARPTSSQ